VPSFYTWCLAQTYIDRIQESPTLELANDCFRFVTGYFEIISASSAHIYHSALVFAPQESMVRKLYEPHACPFTGVVQGVSISWDQNTAAMMYPFTIKLAVWSPCNRFIAIKSYGADTVDVLDSVTLQRLQTLESPQDISTYPMALVFSPDSRILSSVGIWEGDEDLFVVSWDLQTGGVASVVRWEGPTQKVVGNPSITYSANGRMVAVFSWYRDDPNITILISDVVSGVRVDSHSIDGGVPLSRDMWTYGGSLRFATADATTITIWEVGFTSGATPAEAETLPVPDGFEPIALPHVDYDDLKKRVRFLPAPCRLALIFKDKVMVWDVRNSKCLLQYADIGFNPEMSFSSDGRFFACSTGGSDVRLWKESSTGYILHEILVAGVPYPRPLLSRSGESIAAFGDRTIRLWRTKGFATPPCNILTRAPRYIGEFVLDFSHDGMLAVFARLRDETVTVLNLKSGVPQLTIDASIGVYGLGVIGNTVVVIGNWEAVTWSLPAGDFVPDARVGIEESSRTINHRDYDRLEYTYGASISSDSRRIALVTKSGPPGESDDFLHIHNISTGEDLECRLTRGHIPRFSPDGCDIWCADDRGEAEVWRVVGGQKVLELLEQTVDIEVGDPLEGSPWGSSHGYQITDDWWILGPDKKRLLMLPPPWQSEAVQRVWKGRFLALLHGGLSEPVILELDQ